LVHTFNMRFYISILVLGLLVFGSPALFAQDSAPPEDDDGSSEQVEQREDSYRQQMELEDARSRDRTYVDNTHTQKAEQEKIDKLPQESRDSIRDQLVDIIVENGEWEPKDALGEYPYSPTAAAESNSELEQQEQEAWEEQIEKYHEREAAAFGAHRGPVPGPGNPTGQEGGEQGDNSEQGEQGGQQGSGQGGEAGEGKSGAGSAGTYQPYQSSSNSSDDEVSTAGVSESALDFLKGGKGRQQAPPQGAEAQAQAQAETQAQQQAQAEAAAEQQARAETMAQEQTQEQQLAQEQAAESEQSEPEAAAEASQENTEQAQNEQQESSQTVEVDTRGIIAIKDLDKLEGANGSTTPDDQDDP
jgi:hypothetical protein